MTDDLPIVRPSTTEAFAEFIRDAARARRRVRVAGSGSLPLTVFGEDVRPVQEISTPRMNKILEHAVGDMTVTVQAGITLEVLQRHLAWQNQWLPVDPPVSGGAGGRMPGSRTVGGMIASNSLGPLRFLCGDWRLFVLGMRWVDARGTVIRGGGKTVKNVAGYFTPRMMIGSCGSLGAIAEVTLRTFARPEDEQCILFFCASGVQAEALLAQVLLSPTTPAWIQLAGARTFAGNPLQLPSPPVGVMVAVGYLGRNAVCEAQLETLRGLPAAAGLESITQGAVASGRLRQWMAKEPAPGEGFAGFRVFAKSSAAAELVTAFEAAGAPWVASEAGHGVVRGTAPVAAQREIARIAAKFGGRHFSIPTTGAGGVGISDEPLYRRLKARVDPDAIFGDCPV